MAQTAPAPLRGKSIVTSWNENRQYRFLGESSFKPGSFPQLYKFMCQTKAEPSSAAVKALGKERASAAGLSEQDLADRAFMEIR